VAFCGLILDPDTLVQYLDVQNQHLKELETLRIMMYYLKYDKTGRTPFCLFAVEKLIQFFEIKGVRRENLPAEQAIN
jgi:hypothetical protein